MGETVFLMVRKSEFTLFLSLTYLCLCLYSHILIHIYILIPLMFTLLTPIHSLPPSLTYISPLFSLPLTLTYLFSHTHIYLHTLISFISISIPHVLYLHTHTHTFILNILTLIHTNIHTLTHSSLS